MPGLRVFGPAFATSGSPDRPDQTAGTARAAVPVSLAVFPCKRRMTVSHDGTVLAVSADAKILKIERTAFFLLPLRDVFLDYFRVSEEVRHEAGIGLWHASDLHAGGDPVRNAMWTLTETTPATQALFFHARFSAGEIDIEHEEEENRPLRR